MEDLVLRRAVAEGRTPMTTIAGFVFLLDHANLLFHEAGHPLTGIFSQRLEPYGGTVGQLFFPGLLMVSFWRKGRPLALAVATIWFFENFLNIARYMADARNLHDFMSVAPSLGTALFGVVPAHTIASLAPMLSGMVSRAFTTTLG